MPNANEATKALAAGTREALVDSLVRETAPRGREDPRDVMIGLAAFYDCARCLSLLPADVFDEAGERIDDDALSHLVRTFGRRSDVTLEAFGWVCEDGVYRFALGGRSWA